MDQYIGKLLDNRYEILERIGSGGMAVVYKARCHRLNRLVAVKVLKSDLAQDADFRRRFHDESQAVAMLSHPNIVAVYDVSRSEQLDYIVMEMIDGITLKQYMQKKGGALSWREALHFITQIIKALGHAHSRGIIHRDIKPHNIMVLRDGSVKVADFGIARLVSAEQNTLTQEALGSVHYISPEQAKGSHIDARSDLYSAGVVLYEMLTGRLPYEGESPISVAIQHINSIPLLPRELNSEIPEALEAITMKAMAPRMDQRYASADAMLADLEEFRKNPNINFEYTTADLLSNADEPTQVLGRGAQSARREERPVRRREREEEHPEEERPPRKGSSAPTIAAVGAIVLFLLAILYFLWTILSGLINPKEVTYTVPNLLTGMTIEEARANTELLGEFTIEQRKVDYDSDAPLDQILAQDPAPGATVKAGGLVIKVDVAGENEDTFVMGEYFNQPIATVKVILINRGIDPVITEQYDPSVTKTYIISQSVAEGTKLKPGDPVTLYVSLGPEPKEVTMISLLTFTQEAAQKQLEEYGLSVGRVSAEYDAQAPVGTVIWQSVPQGATAKEGDMVDIKISRGPDPAVPTPPVSSEPPSQPPGSEEPTLVKKSITVELPQDQDLVTVVITVAGVERFRQEDVSTAFPRIKPTVEGYGENQEVKIYIEDLLVGTQYVNFLPS